MSGPIARAPMELSRTLRAPGWEEALLRIRDIDEVRYWQRVFNARAGREAARKIQEALRIAQAREHRE